MVERVSQRKREQEPRELLYDYGMRMQNEAVLQRSTGKVIIRGKDREWEQNRQGLIKFMLYMTEWDQVGTPGWNIFINNIKHHSGQHTHQGGLALYVIDGKGYTVVDGVRYDWEDGDLILLPIKPGGCEHQHFNEDPNRPAQWIAFNFRTMGEVVGIGRTQQAEHPDWAVSKPK
ncbi:MAG: cupin domain-containing protein [Dehalococcoidia bacterium]|nr:cupin domain-containing protein [Dehalococcoidia bacterium]